MSLIDRLFRRQASEQELEKELQFHLQEEIASNVAKGMSRDEARRAACLNFGGLEQIKEECRDIRPMVKLEIFLRDVAFALRRLRRAPVFAITAILTTALGIGACTALFSIVNGVLLHPLPFPQAKQIVVLNEAKGNAQEIPVAPAAFLDWSERTTAFSALASVQQRAFGVKIDGHVEPMRANAVTPSYFEVTGIQPFLGRGFSREEGRPGHDHVVILNYYVWKNRFGARPEILNESLSMNGESYAVVGVMPQQDQIWNPPLLVPASFSAAQRSDYGSHGLFVLGRMKDGVSLRDAQTDLDRVSATIARAHRDSNADSGAMARSLMNFLVGDAEKQLLILLTGVGLLFLVACVNLSGLLIARAKAQERELAVRLALGAGRWRVVRQFLGESLIITLLGGALGAYLAYASMGALVRFAQVYVPRTKYVSVDATVLAVTAGLMIIAGLAAGIVPAVQAMRLDVIEGIRGSNRGASDSRSKARFRQLLVSVEIGFAVILLMGAGLLARSFLALQRSDQGFTSDGVQIGFLPFTGNSANWPIEKRLVSIEQVRERLRDLPPVEAVGFSSELPMLGGRGLLFAPEGAAPQPVGKLPSTNSVIIAGDYFASLGIPLKAGRFFGTQDTPSSPRVVIINEQMARTAFPGVDPIGKRIMLYTMANQTDAYREIVGIVGTTLINGPQSKPQPQCYEPFAQHPEEGVIMIARPRAGAVLLAATIKDAVKAVDKGLDLQLPNEPYPQILAGAWARQKFCMFLLGGFAGAGLLLASIGIYGIMAYAVERRRHEFGIRLAIGAERREILRLVLTSCARILVGGSLLGLVGTLAFGRMVESLLYAVKVSDPLTFLAVFLALAIVATIACLIPAWRATHTDPVIALRAE